MQKRVVTLRNSLPAVVNAMTGSKGIKIVWQGPPRTEGHTIWSNPLPVNADEDTVKMVVGDIDHESGHILFSDLDLVNKVGHTLPPLQFGVWNALEDTFEERMMGDRYLGCQETLAESVEIAIQHGACRTGENGPSDALITFIDVWGRKNVLLQNVDPILTGARKELEQYLEAKGVRRLEALLSTKLFSAASTAETLKLSDDVVKLVKDIQEEQEKPQEPPPQQQQGDGGSGNDQGQNSGAGGDDGGQDDSSGSGDGQGGSNGPDGTGSRDGATQKDASNDAQTGGGAGHGGRAREILDDTNVDTNPVINRRELANEMAQEAAQSNFQYDGNCFEKPVWGDNAPRYQTLKQEVSGHIAMLQRRLAVEFMSRRRARTVVGEEGRIDGRLLHRAVWGDTRIRRQKTVVTTPLPAVSLALDCSGSMDGGSIQLATQAVIALCEVCSAMGVPVEVVTFEGYRVGVIKSFDESLATVRSRIGSIGAGGGTPTAEGLWVAGNRLVARKEERKILMLVTDGAANDMAGAKQVADMIEHSGIELYGIGLGTEAIRHVCQKSGVISRADDLADAILSALAERMLGAA